jgi:SAM-dependent methyltransferase
MTTTNITMDHTMLGRRYRFNRQPMMPMNDLQLAMKKQVEVKLKTGAYVFETIPCHVCGGDDFDQIAAKERHGLEMSTVVCKTCGLVQTNPRMNQESYNEFYNVEYRKLYRGDQAPNEEFYSEQYDHGKRIYEYLEGCDVLPVPAEGALVFEVGCGCGGILGYFQSCGYRVRGCDLDAGYGSFGKSAHNLDISIRVLEDIDIEEQADIVIYSHVLEHILDPRTELQLVKRLLKPDGILYVGVPGLKDLMTGTYNMDLMQYLQNAHVYHFTLTTLVNTILPVGFELVHGDEVVHSVFRTTDSPKAEPTIENDYNQIMNYCRRTEWYRRWLPVSPFQMKNAMDRFHSSKAAALISILLRKIGIRNFYEMCSGKFVESKRAMKLRIDIHRYDLPLVITCGT